MAVNRGCNRVPGDPHLLLPALQRVESVGAEGDGPRSGSGPRRVPWGTPSNWKYVRITTPVALPLHDQPQYENAVLMVLMQWLMGWTVV